MLLCYVNPNFILEFFITWLKIVIASLDVFSITLSHVFTVMHCDYMRIFFHSVIVGLLFLLYWLLFVKQNTCYVMTWYTWLYMHVFLALLIHMIYMPLCCISYMVIVMPQVTKIKAFAFIRENKMLVFCLLSLWIVYMIYVFAFTNPVLYLGANLAITNPLLFVSGDFD